MTISLNTGSTISCLVVQGNAASTASCEESSAVINCLAQAVGTQFSKSDTVFC